MFAATTAAALGQAVMGSMGDTRDYNRKIGALNAEADAINKSTIFKYKMTSLAQQQMQDRAAAEVGQRKVALAEARGTAGAAAASAGVEGPSVEALLNSFDVATGHDISTIYLNRDAEIAQSRAEQKGFELDATNRLTSLKQQIPDDPSTKMLGRMFNAAFQVGGAYAQYTTRDPTTGQRRFG